MSIEAGTALIIVDVQNDFCDVGGALALPGATDIIPNINELIQEFQEARAFIVVSRDWHPANSLHFNKWPVHCVRDTPGANFHPSLILPEEYVLVSKGTQLDDDGYSAFDGLDSQGGFQYTLLEHLDSREIWKLVIAGVATDYCVRATACDAEMFGFEVVVPSSCVKAVGPDDAALDFLARRGYQII